MLKYQLQYFGGRGSAGGSKGGGGGSASKTTDRGTRYSKAVGIEVKEVGNKTILSNGKDVIELRPQLNAPPGYRYDIYVKEEGKSKFRKIGRSAVNTSYSGLIDQETYRLKTRQYGNLNR